MSSSSPVVVVAPKGLKDEACGVWTTIGSCPAGHDCLYRHGVNDPRCKNVKLKRQLKPSQVNSSSKKDKAELPKPKRKKPEEKEKDSDDEDEKIEQEEEKDKTEIEQDIEMIKTKATKLVMYKPARFCDLVVFHEDSSGTFMVHKAIVYENSGFFKRKLESAHVKRCERIVIPKGAPVTYDQVKDYFYVVYGELLLENGKHYTRNFVDAAVYFEHYDVRVVSGLNYEIEQNYIEEGDYSQESKDLLFGRFKDLLKMTRLFQHYKQDWYKAQCTELASQMSHIEDISLALAELRPYPSIKLDVLSNWKRWIRNFAEDNSLE